MDTAKKNRRVHANFLGALRKHSSAWPFLNAVDVIAAPDYYQVIKDPRDLMLIQTKLPEYASDKELIDDLILMLQNCFTYNPPTHVVHQTARAFLTFLKDQTSRAFPHLVISEQNGAIVALDVIDPHKEPPRPKRTIKAPKVFEPEHVANPTKRRESSKKDPLEILRQLKRQRESGEYDGDENGLQIETLATCLQTMNAQLAMLQNKKKPASSSVSAKRSKLIAQQLENVRWITEDTITEDTVVLEPGISHSFQCEHCFTREERIWRAGPSGPATLCNKCGVIHTNAQLATNASARKKKKTKVFTEDMKQELTSFISAMSSDAEFMEKVLNIVVKGMPHLKNIEQEMELDLNQVPSPVLWKLWSFCKKIAGETGGVVLQQQAAQAKYAHSDSEDSDSD